MYEHIKTNKRDGIITWTREITSANILEVEAGTNGIKGGDTGHGSRTYFRIEDLSCTDMTANVTKNGFEVRIGGDCELVTIIEALKFIADILEGQIKTYENEYGDPYAE